MSDTAGHSSDQEEICFLSAEELVAVYRARTLSPLEVTRAVLERIGQLDSKLNAYCLVDEGAALAAAAASEQRWRAGTPLGLLDGVPASIKDIVLTQGWPTLRGSRTISPAQRWDEDAPAVARLREHGAVLLGKTCTPEFAFAPVTRSPLTGETLNPWNLSCTPGGSSGGAGAAVAAGMGPLALGTDAGGSIRIPSSFCGIFGLKPTGGRVPTYPPTPLASLVGFGPMTRSVGDAARMLSVISEPDPRDWTAAAHDPTPYHERLEHCDPASWRIAWSPTLGYVDVDGEVAAITGEAVRALSEAGVRIDLVEHVFDDPIPIMERLRRAFTSHAFRDFGARELDMMDPHVRARIEDSRGAVLEDYFDAEMARAALGRKMLALHAEYQLLVTPTLAVAPFSIGQLAPPGWAPSGWTGPCYPFNLTRQPAANVPCGFTAQGLPVGLQIVGPPHADLLVLQAARVFEKLRPWARRRPVVGLQ